MVGEELQLGDVVHLLHAVNLDALVIVDISPFLLSNSKKVLGVQPLDCVDRLARTDLASQSLRLPVKSCNVATPDEKDYVNPGVGYLPAPKHKVSTVSSVTACVRTKLGQFQVKTFGCRLCINSFPMEGVD